tara:strand:+ start:437 stop:778 length:342 start_codon:yes stop_codon:yes gene_type:complete
MIIYIDIDETIAHTPKSRNYSESKPWKENIKKANRLYDAGHKIVYWTARGSGSGIDWTDITRKQLDSWGVKYHDLKLGKPIYDLFIDDKNMNTDDWSDEITVDSSNQKMEMSI